MTEYKSQYAYIARNREKYNEYARAAYHRCVSDPLRKAKRDVKRKEWYAKNKEDQLRKQRETKAKRKLWAIEYLGGCCQRCLSVFHPAVFEFHHRNPLEKDKDPSKMLLLKLETLRAELDKCDLLCANCHRLIHHEGGQTV